MELGSFNDRDDDEHNGFGFVEISNIFVMLNEFFGGAVTFDKP